MILKLKFLTLIGLASSCSNTPCPPPDSPVIDEFRYTCAYAQCAEGTSQPNGNQLCLTNYDSLDLAQYNCYLYKCDDLIQYEHNGSVKYEILKRTGSNNYCIDSLKGFKVLEPQFEPPSEPTYTCIDSPCITTTNQPNGNQYCIINYGDFGLAKGACEFYGCDTIIRYSHNQQFVYELLKEVNIYEDEVGECGNSVTKSDIEFLSPYSNNVDANFESVVEIRDHSTLPFKQYTRFYPDQKITEIQVEAHNDYEQNVFFLLHEHQLRIAVIGNHTCIFSDINAYDIDSVPNRNSQPNLTSGQANRDNVITIQVQSSYRESDIKIDSLPTLIIDKCEDREILELEYLRLVDETTSETATIADQPFELPVGEHNPQARSNKQCELTNCDGAPSEYLMAAQCSGERKCPEGGTLPNCWYALGTTQQSMQNYYHFTNSQMSCVPCCNVRSRNSKMPVCSQVAALGDLCEWYFTKGRCPHFK